jgi:MFS family permease
MAINSTDPGAITAPPWPGLARGARLLLGISIFWLPLSLLFDGMSTLVVPAVLLGLVGEGSRATLLGLITAAGLLSGMLVPPLAGAFSDRLQPHWGRRPVLATGAGLIVVGLGVFNAAQGILLVLVGYLLVQTAASVAQAALQGFLPDLVPIEWRGCASGIKGFMDLGGSLLGFVLLGALLGRGSATAALLAIAGIVVTMLVLTLALVREPQSAAKATVPRVSLLDAFRLDVRRHQAFAGLVVSRFLFLLGSYAVGRFLLFFVADRLGLRPDAAAEQAGGLLAALTLLTLLSVPPGGWLADRFGRRPLMLAGAGLSAVGTGLLAFANSATLILLFGGLMALGSSAFYGANWAMIADLAPPAEAGRFYGLANIGTAGAAAAAGLLGLVVDQGNGVAPGLGYTALFVAAAGAFVASAVALRGVAAADRPPASRAGVLASGGPTAEAGDVG